MIQKPTTLSVIGSGSWGTALAITVAQTIDNVILWGKESEEIEAIKRDGVNSRYLPDTPLPDNIVATDQFDEVINDDLCFLIVVPSHAFRTVLTLLHSQLLEAGKNPDKAVIVWGTKGLEPKTQNLLSDVAADVFGGQAVLGVVAGPSFAKETAAKQPTAFTVASSNLEEADALANWFRTPATRAYHGDDIIGTQIGGAVKNVMAIAAGISAGLGYGANAAAALMTRGLSEITRLGLKLNAKPATLTGLSGMGDLVLTCTDNLSRNRRFGLGLGEGKSQEQVIKEIAQEIEGINTALEVNELAKRLDVDMPITRQVFMVVHQGKDPRDAVDALLNRDSSAE